MGERICVIEDCGREHAALGYCESHYYRLRKYGDPHKVRRQAMSVEERFWSKVDGDGDCWEWMAGACSSGYGTFSTDGKEIGAHRWAYEHLVGPIPDSLHIDHLCRNRRCVNPDHLEPVTQMENVRRGLAGERMRVRTHCPMGHPYDVMKANGRRGCKRCMRAACRRYYHARTKIPKPVGM